MKKHEQYKTEYVEKSMQEPITRAKVIIDWIVNLIFVGIGFLIYNYYPIPSIKIYLIWLTCVNLLCFIITNIYMLKEERGQNRGRFLYKAVTALNKSLSLFIFSSMFTQFHTDNNWVILWVYLYPFILWMIVQAYSVLSKISRGDYKKKTDEEILRKYTRNAIFFGVFNFVITFFFGKEMKFQEVLAAMVLFYLAAADAYIIVSNFIRYFYAKKPQ